MGPLEATKPWNTSSVEGITRFLDRVWRLYVDDEDALAVDDSKPAIEARRVVFVRGSKTAHSRWPR